MRIRFTATRRHYTSYSEKEHIIKGITIDKNEIVVFLPWNNKTNITCLSSAEFVRRVVKVN